MIICRGSTILHLIIIPNYITGVQKRGFWCPKYYYSIKIFERLVHFRYVRDVAKQP